MLLKQLKEKKGDMKAMKINNDIKTHLEYLGYAMAPYEDDLLFMKPGFPSTFLTTLSANRILIKGSYGVNSNGEVNELSYLRFINELNIISDCTTFIAGEKTLVFTATYNGIYDRIEFGQIMQGWENDVTTLLYHHSKTQFFLSEDCPNIDMTAINQPVSKQYQA
mgnify:FL=1